MFLFDDGRWKYWLRGWIILGIDKWSGYASVAFYINRRITNRIHRAIFNPMTRLVTLVTTIICRYLSGLIGTTNFLIADEKCNLILVKMLLNRKQQQIKNDEEIGREVVLGVLFFFNVNFNLFFFFFRNYLNLRQIQNCIH